MRAAAVHPQRHTSHWPDYAGLRQSGHIWNPKHYLGLNFQPPQSHVHFNHYNNLSIHDQPT